MKQKPRELGYLPLDVIKEKMALPSEKIMKNGVVAIIECVEHIPCDPCVGSCRKGAIIKESLSTPPVVDYQKCTGCALCVASCPGLAIFVVDSSLDDKAIVYIPYEMLPIPETGDRGDALDRCGKPIGSAQVAKVQKGIRKTAILGLLVEKELAMSVRSIRFTERSNE